MLAAITVPIVVIRAIARLEPNQRRMSVSRSTRPNASKVGFSMSHVVLVVSSLGFRAVSRAHSTGTSQISANAISTPAQIRLNSLWRESTWAASTVRRAAVGSRMSLAVTSGSLLLASDDAEPDGGHGEHDQE